MLASVPSAGRALMRSHRARPWLERLETRALLSGTETPISAALSAAQAQRTAPTHQELLFQQSLHQHPLVEGQVTSTTSLPWPAVVFTDNQVQVFVPGRDLPSTSPPGTAQPQNDYSYAFWAGISPSAPNGIAGFAPEHADTSVVATGFPSS